MTNTIPNVPRDWIYRVRDLLYEVANETGELGKEAFCIGSFIPDILSAPSPAGVDGLEVVGYVSQDDIKWQGYCTLRLKPYSDYVIPLCRLSDAQAIIDGLRGENERIRLNIAEYNEAISCYQSERDQQAQRIGELEGLLREVHDTYRAAIHWQDLRGTMKRIDAALSASKDSAS